MYDKRMSKLTLEYDIPEEISNLTNTLNTEELRELAIAIFYAKGHLSISEASQILRKTHREFVALLQNHHIPVGGTFEAKESDLENRLLGI
jgi:predicted HTH domain antitoxin